MTTIAEVLSQIHVQTAGHGHHHGRQGWTNIDCPFCQESGKFHLGIHDLGSANCWKCGPHSLYEVLRALTRDAQETSEILASLHLVRRPGKARVSGHLSRPGGVSALGPMHIRYLRRRGLDASQAATLWGAMGIGIAAKLRWRIFIPIVHLGQEVSWTTRAVKQDADRRYITAGPEEESMPAKSLLYGEDYVRSAVIVHEGPLDVWKTGPGAVALFGLNYSGSQVARIAKYPLRVICLDNAEKAQFVGKKLADDLSVFPGKTIRVQLESGTDPGSADDEEIAELRQKFLE